MAEKHNINKKIEEILDLTDQCVKCGMCLPHCPTNQLTKLEGHSPRGRIALWQNLANGKLELTEKTYDYLNQCLGCGACVNNCPAGVEFLDIQDTGKSYLLPNQTASKPSITRAKLGFLTRVFITIFSSKKHTQKLHYFLYYYQKLRLHYIFNTIILPLKLLRLQILNKLLDKINNLYLALPKISRHNKTQAGVLNPISEVILFTGCVNKIAANNTITAALTILGKLNIKAHLVDNLHCCGALFKHNGKLDKFDTNSKYNIENINKLLETNSKISTILSIDTGCHPELAQQFRKLKNIQVVNVEQFILRALQSQNEQKNISEGYKNIFIYTPCSQREQLKTPDLTYNLLKQALPNANIQFMPTGYGCCGAAGTYMFENPDTAEKLSTKILDDFFIQNPEYKTNNDKFNEIIICTSNIGCKLHLTQQFLTKYNIKTLILSPLEILATPIF